MTVEIHQSLGRWVVLDDEGGRIGPFPSVDAAIAWCRAHRVRYRVIY